ncbi:hypothetical protein FHP25_24790 [Vineibacter terrae]|uniref:Uncharacterized protein n=1 Tax=Vineibacter terrae TaxID=2586908 RepID=A0A5C8PFW6_9HYPH|nr:hypothetical protein [Vineibacter terrae]TXL72516.1 hypothetical protein FHP25_24790 [Vineibacter terrae]
MSQLELHFAKPRRIDITIERLIRLVDELSAEERATLQEGHWSWWAIVITVMRVRAMERAEERVGQQLGMAADAPLADAYDRVVQPGVGHPADALLRTFKEVYATKETR